jgi:glyoxylase I family protein
VAAPTRGLRDPATSVAGLHHAALSVRDVEAASRWYADVLGLEETFRRDSETCRVVVLHAPGRAVTLGLVEHRAEGAEFSPRNLGLDHLAFRVGSGDELAAWARRLEERGVACSGPTDTPFGGMVHFSDPDGIALALFWQR